jgi:hypothetical protein
MCPLRCWPEIVLPLPLCLQGGAGGEHADRHTTDTTNMQSILDRNDLDELMAMVSADVDTVAVRQRLS